MTKTEANQVARLLLKAGYHGVTVCEWWDNGYRGGKVVNKVYTVECQNRGWVKRVFESKASAQADIAGLPY
jgi:hypothetical protein